MTDPRLTDRDAKAAFNAAAKRADTEKAAQGGVGAEGAKRGHRPEFSPGGGSVGAPQKTPFQLAAEKLAAQPTPGGRPNMGKESENDSENEP